MDFLYTIGFTGKTARTFFNLLKQSGIRTLLDTRLNNTGQLSGFSKKEDLRFFTENLTSARYEHWTEAAPTAEMLDSYKKKQITWSEYERIYLDLISARRVEDSVFARDLSSACLLCSEQKPHHCHRRLLAEYLASKCSVPLPIKHLV